MGSCKSSGSIGPYGIWQSAQWKRTGWGPNQQLDLSIPLARRLLSARKQNRKNRGIEFGQDVEYGRPWG